MAALTASLLALSAASQFAGQRREAGVYDQNARLADQQRADAIARGQVEESAVRRNTRQVIGSQRASLAGQGVALDSGSPLALQAESARLGELDALTARNNAAREAFGYEVEAQNYRNARDTSSARARGTLLTSAAQLYAQGRDSGYFTKRKPLTVQRGTLSGLE